MTWSVSVGTATDDVSYTSSRTVTLPTTSTGDLIVIVVCYHATAGTGTDYSISITGYTGVFGNANDLLVTKTAIFYKIAGASESNPTISTPRTSECLCQAFVLANPSNTPLEDSGASNDTSETAIDLTLPVPDCFVLGAAQSTSGTALTPPSGFSTGSTGSSGGRSQGIYYKVFPSSGTTGSMTIQGGGTERWGFAAFSPLTISGFQLFHGVEF